MNAASVELLLHRVAEGRCSVSDAIKQFAVLPFTEAADTLADTHREIRSGLPEVVFAQSKTEAQVAEAFGALVRVHGYALATHVSSGMAEGLMKKFSDGKHDATSSLFHIGRMSPRSESGSIAVVCAGTSDLPVAEEAAQTLEFAGAKVQRLRDVGVAGLHRLLGKLEVIRESKVIIVIAGMEGALPGVLAGLVSAPVIAVPTSVGYGAALDGFAALLTMLNACSSGIGVVNIDNGFGAAVLALRILRQVSS